MVMVTVVFGVTGRLRVRGRLRIRLREDLTFLYTLPRTPFAYH